MDVLLGHLAGHILVTVPEFMVLLTDLQQFQELHKLGCSSEPVLNRNSFQVSLLLTVHADGFGEELLLIASLSRQGEVQVSEGLVLSNCFPEILSEARNDIGVI